LIVAVLAHAPGSVLVCDVGALTGRATDIIDTLARMQLTAIRGGGRIRLCNAQPELVALLELVGLGDVLPVVDWPR
jgi:hypothetical protein